MPDLITPLLLFFGILYLLVIVAGAVATFLPKRKASFDFPYKKQASLFTPAERSFLGVLEQSIGDQNKVFGKVRLSDVIKVKGLNGSLWKVAMNRIQSKHLDFVVCNPSDLSIQFAVELYESSHNRERSKKGDAFKGQAL